MLQKAALKNANTYPDAARDVAHRNTTRPICETGDARPAAGQDMLALDGTSLPRRSSWQWQTKEEGQDHECNANDRHARTDLAVAQRGRWR